MLADRLERLMTPAKILLKLGPAQIKVSVLEPDFLGGHVAVGDLERRRRRRAHRLELADQHFDLARRQLRVDGPLRTAHDFAFRRDVELGAHLARRLMRRRVMHRVHHQLHDPRAVAQIDKDKTAMIAPRLDPSPERNLAPDIGGPNRAAEVGTLPGRKRRILLSFRHHTSQIRF